MKQPNAPYNAIKETGSEVAGEGKDVGEKCCEYLLHNAND